MSNYHIGRRLEYIVRLALQNEGYIVVRSAASKSPIDLVAINRHEILLIQCKYKGDNSKLETYIARQQRDMEPLLELIPKSDCVKLYLAVREKGKTGTILIDVATKEIKPLVVKYKRGRRPSE